eukprot:TRINITY_DN54227_c0_g1_i1.p1 TRINITY_DN54227_c0_g1~~TRINITY_DN54227_c0_g1_i1.p1  ORF type:complete len:190 (+),score=22.63 TRINITY_DN54227_c0_g1_i1:60-629(+)
MASSGPIEYKQLSHFNIVVDDIDAAQKFYSECLGFVPVHGLNGFCNAGFARSAGLSPGANCIILVMTIPSLGLNLELMRFLTPSSGTPLVTQATKQTQHMGGVGHICLIVKDVVAAYEKVRSVPGVRVLCDNAEKLDAPEADSIELYTEAGARVEDTKRAGNLRDIIGTVKCFHFVDPYGVQWVMDQIG